MNNIKKCREIKGLNTKQLAECVGVSKRHLQFIEKGERLPSLPVAKKIAECLDDSIENIFFDEELEQK